MHIPDHVPMPRSTPKLLGATRKPSGELEKVPARLQREHLPRGHKMELSWALTKSIFCSKGPSPNFFFNFIPFLVPRFAMQGHALNVACYACANLCCTILLQNLDAKIFGAPMTGPWTMDMVHTTQDSSVPPDGRPGPPATPPPPPLQKQWPKACTHSIKVGIAKR